MIFLAAPWFADPQMDVLGHDCITHQRKAVAVPGFSENLHKYVSSTN
jgi:hypothetical protein